MLTEKEQKLKEKLKGKTVEELLDLMINSLEFDKIENDDEN
ncbi:hypothetical protein [Cetobacterium somerae]